MKVGLALAERDAKGESTADMPGTGSWSMTWVMGLPAAMTSGATSTAAHTASADCGGKRTAVIKERRAHAHDVPYGPIYPCIVNRKINVRVVDKRYKLFPGGEKGCRDVLQKNVSSAEHSFL